MYRVKRFTAATTAEAVLLAKRELGPDVFIAEVRRVRPGGLLGMLQKSRAEVTAIGDVGARLTGTAPAPAPVQAAVPAPVRQPAADPQPDRNWQTVQRELRLVADAVGRLEHRMERRVPARWQQQARRLLTACGLPEELAAAMAADLLSRARPHESIRAALLRAVPTWLAPTATIGAVAGRQRVVALVGPTGAGKTTTIAKLAGRFALQTGLRVGLLAADGYRIGAVEQLRTYAEIMGLPVACAAVPEDVAGALLQMADRDLVLVDTAGCTAGQTHRWGGVDGLLRVLQPDEVHLVISLVTAPRDAIRAAQAYAVLGVNRLILTKRDEASGPAALLALQYRFGWPLSYITHGQSVPDDLAAAAEVDWPALVDPAAGVVGGW